MRKKILLLLLTSLLLVFSSCNNSEEKKPNNNRIIAYVDSIPITLNQIDYKIRQEIYDELNRIYLIRKIALDETIKENILELEASKHNLSYSELLNTIYTKEVNRGSLQKFIENNHYEKTIPSLERSLVHYDIYSKEGNETLIRRFKEAIVNEIVDSLKQIYKTTIFLSPPVSPEIRIDNLLIHYSGNLAERAG